MKSMKKYVQKYVDVIKYLFDKCITKFEKPKNSESKEYLLVRMDLLGDFFVFFPFFLRYIKQFDDYIFLINSIYEPIIIKYTKNYIVVNFKKYRLNFHYRIKMLKLIAKYHFSYAINFIPHRDPKIADEIISVCNSNNKVCYIGDDINIDNSKYFYNKFYNIKIPFLENSKNKKYYHIFEHEKAIYHYLCNKKIKNVKNFYLHSFDDFKKRLIKKYNFKYVCIITDASTSFRKYPPKNWQIILNNLPKDIKVIQLGLNKFPLKHPNLIDLIGKTTLDEAMSIVMNASLVIGNETGLTHLGYLSGVPTACILGGGHFGRFLPWKEFDDVVKCAYNKMDCFQCGWRCKHVNLKKGEVPPCIKNIKPEKIIESINELNEKYNIM